MKRFTTESLSNSRYDMDILCFSSSDWHGIWGSRQQVMKRFAQRGYRVLFVERPVGLEHLWRYQQMRKRKIHRWREGLRKIEDNLWIVSLLPLLPGRYYSIAINKVNQWLTILQTKYYLRKLCFLSPLLWLYNPEQGPLIGHFHERLSIYHCIDEFTVNTHGRKRRTISSLEKEILSKVDIVFANSLLTYENKRRFNSHTYRIPSGADVEHFAKALSPSTPVHPAIANLPRPRIGYIGYINERLDYEILEYLAGERPDWSLVFVGGTYPWTPGALPLSRLRRFSNVYFLGEYPFAEMPALVKGMDVCLLPYVNDERARYRSPLKLYEYLAAGKPVVSTDHPEARELGGVIYLASSTETFLARIAQALAQDNQDLQRQRAAVARQHSWERRVERMEQIITTYLDQKRD